MSLVFSPTDLSQNELEDFSHTVTVTEDQIEEPIPVVKILTATIDAANVTVEHTDTTFTVSGIFSDVFAREITYIDNKFVTSTVPSFNDISSGFNAVVKYIGPLDFASIEKHVELTFENHGNVSYLITVSSNSATANAALVAKVQEGKI